MLPVAGGKPEEEVGNGRPGPAGLPLPQAGSSPQGTSLALGDRASRAEPHGHSGFSLKFPRAASGFTPGTISVRRQDDGQ